MDRGPEGLLGPVGDVRGKPFPADLLQQILLREPPQLQSGGEMVAELHHPVVQEWEPSLHGMPHGHTVALGGQQILGEEDGNFQVLRLVQRIPCIESVRVEGSEFLPAFLDGSLQILAEEPLRPGRGAPPDAVGIVRGLCLRESHAEEGLRVVRPGQPGQPWIDAVEQPWAEL